MRLNIREESIVHIFVVSEGEGSKCSPFQGFNTCLFSEEYQSALSITTLLPMNVLEVYMDVEDLLSYRAVVENSSLMIIDVKYLKKRMAALKNHPFVFFTLFEDVFDYVKDFSKDFEFLPFFISDHPDSDINIYDKSVFKIDDYVMKRLSEVESKIENYNAGLIKDKPRDKKNIKLNIPSRHHSVTRANEFLFLSLGYMFDGDDNIKPSKSNDVYIEAIIKSYRQVKSEIRNFRLANKSDLVVYSPSMFSVFYNFKGNFWNQISRELKSPIKKDFLIKGIFKNKSYSGASIDLDDKIQIEDLMNDKIVQTMMLIRQHELALSSLAVSGLSIQNLCPSIRLPNGINFHQDILNDLESLSKSKKIKSIRSFSKKFKKLCEAYIEDIGDDLMEVIKENESITICSDVPLEWIYVSEVPLMFTHEISKIHTTIGTQFLKSALNYSSVTFDVDDLKKITVLRSFKESDAIKPMLEESINYYLKDVNDFDLKVIDVHSKEDFFNYIGKDSSSILIIDCHGNHGGNESHGWLQIGNDRVDILELNAVSPPIVLLSACLTAAISGSHASVANGFLDKGAISVLGTFLPVDARKSSVFIARLLYKISGYLDALKGAGVDSINWRSFLSEVLKRSFLSDVLTVFEDAKWITMSESKKINERVNMAILSNNKNWPNLLAEEIAIVTGKSEKEALTFIKDIGFFETMNYSQIGRPENIIIKIN